MIGLKLFKRFKRSFDKMSLKTRILMMVSCIIILTIFSSNYLLIQYSNKFIHSLSNNFIDATMDQAVNTINSDLFEDMYKFSDLMMKNKKIWEMLTVDPHHIPSEEWEIDKVMFGEKIRKDYVAGLEKIKIVALLGRNGEIYSVSYCNEFDRKTLEKFSYMEKECKKTTSIKWLPLQNYSYNSSINEERRIKHSVWAYRALRNPYTGEYMGIGVFSISEKEIYNMYKNSRINNLSETFIFQNTGEVVSSSKFDEDERLEIDKDYAEFLTNNSGKRHIIKEQGKQFLILTKPLRIERWFVSVKIPVHKIYQEESKIMFLGIVMIIIFISISSLLVDALTKKIVKPIKKIIRAMELTEQGNLDTRVAIEGQYEISEMAQYFNRMVNRMRNMILVEYELERKKKQAEMDVLMSQINPHFLYNTLESIVWKAQIAGESEISEMAAALGDIYRIGVNHGELLVSVADELKHVNAYAAIQKMRYKDKFEFECRVEDESLLKLYTIKMLLQPIVENAIVHGMKLDGTPIKVRVEVNVDKERLMFSVLDNGIGIEEERLKGLKEMLETTNVLERIQIGSDSQKYTGIGIKNTNERIKLYFGHPYSVNIETKKENGIKVDIIVPIIKNGLDFKMH